VSTLTERRWEDNFKMDVKEAGCEDVDSTQLTQDTIQQKTLMNTAKRMNFLTT